MTKESSSTGIGVFGLTFLVLKLAEIGQVKDWSWWLVTSPLWIPICIGIALFIVWMLWHIALEKRDKQTDKTVQIKKSSRFQDRLERMGKERNKK